MIVLGRQTVDYKYQCKFGLTKFCDVMLDLTGWGDT